MKASQIVAVVDAVLVNVKRDASCDGFVLSLLVLDGGRVLVLDPEAASDVIYASMLALMRDGASRGWTFGELTFDDDTLARMSDGYELDGDAVVIGGE